VTTLVGNARVSSGHLRPRSYGGGTSVPNFFFQTLLLTSIWFDLQHSYGNKFGSLACF